MLANIAVHTNKKILHNRLLLPLGTVLLLEDISGVGRGNRGNVVPPPPESKKCCRKRCYLPEVYTFGEVAEIIEKFSEKLYKKSIFHRDLDQKISKLS